STHPFAEGASIEGDVGVHTLVPRAGGGDAAAAEAVSTELFAAPRIAVATGGGTIADREAGAETGEWNVGRGLPQAHPMRATTQTPAARAEGGVTASRAFRRQSQPRTALTQTIHGRAARGGRCHARRELFGVSRTSHHRNPAEAARRIVIVAKSR